MWASCKKQIQEDPTYPFSKAPLMGYFFLLFFLWRVLVLKKKERKTLKDM